MANLKIFAKIIEDKAKQQIETLVSQPAFADCKVRIMPDVHAGSGCVIGFTADLGDKVIPNIVGVDIGCGMRVVRLFTPASMINLKRLDDIIKSNIPSGFEIRNKSLFEAPLFIKRIACYDELQNRDRFEKSLGTLGGGNHFIEVDRDDEDNAYLVIHTGSRNLGKQVCDIYQRRAESMLGKEALVSGINSRIKELKSEGREKEIEREIALIKQRHEDGIVPKELSYLTGDERTLYLNDMRICQKYAVLNRLVIMQQITAWLEGRYAFEYADRTFETVHNYIDNNNMIRKGAVRANAGERLIIPMNMRDGSLICIGKGNEDWNCSAPHGAGRIMSRMQAKRELTVDQFAESMKGIYTTTADETTIDEAPMAYKPMDSIIDCIGDTVDIERIIKPIYNFKASE